MSVNGIWGGLFAWGVLWLGYVYAGYPLLAALLAWVRRVRPAARADYLPSVSVLIAARNEEQDISWKIRETLAWDYPPGRLEVLVVSDASEDSTDEIVQSIDDPRVRLFRLPRRGGKGRGLNLLAGGARGEILLFTDANAHVGPGCLRALVRHFADQRVGCVTGGTHPVGEGGSAAYFGYEGFLARLESRAGRVLVCDGALFCVRRALFQPLDPDLANDLELPLRIAAEGFWILYEPAAQVEERDTSSPWQEFARRRRIAAQGALGMWRLRHTLRGLRGWQFLSHKALRWLTPVPLALILLSSIALREHGLFLGLLALQAVFYGLGGIAFLLALYNRPAPRIAALPFYVVLGSLATLTGVLDAATGRRFAVWEIPTLARGPLAAFREQDGGERP